MSRTLFSCVLLGISAAAVGHVIEQRTTTSSLPSGWSYVGCLIDGGGARILLSASETVNSNSPQGCIAFCTSSGYTMAGVEYASQCWCGNAYSAEAGNVQTAPDSDCNLPCSGDSTQSCGAGNRLQTYSYKKSGTTTTTTSSKTSTTTTSKPTTSTTTSKSTTSTSSDPTSTAVGKRGIAWPSTNTQNPEVLKSKQVNFLYNWGSVKTAADIDIPFYAMQWSDAGAASLAANVKAAGANTILGFNEPDVALQSNMTPAFAAATWKTYINPLGSGRTLVSPAVTNGGPPTGLTWLDQFMGNCTSCQIDAIALHWYGGWIDDLQSFIEAAKKYQKPLFVTELGFSWDSTATVESFTEFFPLAFDYLDNEPAVAHYAFFGAFYDGTAKDQIYQNGSLTDVGRLYIS